MNKISVIIITKNESQNIKYCLESVIWADEIIVVDSGSNDNTVDIAKKYTYKVIYNEWKGYANQKLFALQQANNEWVLSLDADERVTESLKNEILKLDENNADGYFIKRDNYFLGRLIRGCGWGNDYQLRLFRKSRTSLTNRLVHEGFVVDGVKKKLQNPIKHYSYRNFKEAFDKINYYSTLEAIEKQNKKNVNTFTLLLTPVIAFLQPFILRKGYIDGIYGAMVSLLNAYTKLQVQMKIWELKKNHNSR
jgi:glycosyltransferase involved in cell wall biosynthesis